MEEHHTLFKMKKKKIIIEDFYRNRPLRIYDVYAPTIRRDRQGLKVLTINAASTADKHDAEGRSSMDLSNSRGNGTNIFTQGTVRKFTPRECLRLQGVDEGVIDKLIASGISDTQLYKAAGDAVTVTVVEAIANKMISIWKESNGNA